MKKALALCASLFALCLCASVQAADASPAQAAASEKAISINAEKVVLNINGAVLPPFPQEAAQEDGKGKSSFRPPPPPQALNFSESVLRSIDKLSSWDGLQAWKIVYLLCGFVLSLLVSRGVRWLIESYLCARFAKRTQTELDDLLFQALGRPASMLVFVAGLYVSVLPILGSMPSNFQTLCERLFLAFGASSIAWAAYRLVEVLDAFLLSVVTRGSNSVDDVIVGIIRKIVKVCIVFVSVIFIGQNILGLNITTLLAGAGVVGLAIAFAAQDTIANFFGSLMIVIDKPFAAGDYVKIDSYEGNIEHVGLRSTALRTPNGHLITIPNKTAANSSVENITRRPFLRRVANYGLVYDTSPEKLERALKILEEIFRSHEGMAPDKPAKIHFNEFKDSSLNIQVITWYHPADYFKHLDWLTKTNLEILLRFNAEGIEFAFPTTTTFLSEDPKRKLGVHLEEELKS